MLKFVPICRWLNLGKTKLVTRKQTVSETNVCDNHTGGEATRLDTKISLALTWRKYNLDQTKRLDEM